MEVVVFLVVFVALLLAVHWAIKGEWKKLDVEEDDYQPPQPYDLYGLPNPEEVMSVIYPEEEEEMAKTERRVVYHVVPHKEGWAIKRSREVVDTHPTKAEAVQRGMELGRSHVKGQLVIHKKDGTIQEERTYGADPRKTKG